MTVDIRNLTLKYALSGGRSVRALNDVSLKVNDNEILGIVGESGCGKSTLAYTVVQVLPKNASITEGKVLLDGRDLLRLSERKLQDVRWTKIAMVFQSSMNAFSPVHRILDQLAAVHMTHLGSLKKNINHNFQRYCSYYNTKIFSVFLSLSPILKSVKCGDHARLLRFRKIVVEG